MIVPCLSAIAAGSSAFAHWPAVLDAIPEEWYRALETNPHRLKLCDLPLSATRASEISSQGHFVEQVIRTELNRRAQQHWRKCPSVDEKIKWFVRGDENPGIVSHIRGCARCHGNAPRLAVLLLGTNAHFTYEHAVMRMRSIGAQLPT